MATLCDYCSALAEGLSALSPAGFELEDSLLPIDYQTFASTVYYYHPSASELLDSALDCALCSCVSRAVEQYRSQYGQLDTTDDDPVIIRVKGRYLRPGEFKVLSCLIQTLNTDAICIQCSLYCDAGDVGSCSGQLFLSPPALPGSPASLEWIQERMNYCLSNHERCNRDIAGAQLDLLPALPTRVLDLGEGQDCSTVRLVEGAGTQAAYTALSYCWGLPNQWPLRTTHDNLQQHTSGISMESLEPTYRDAICITRSLGIRYLWIDALCIIQGDDQDWKHECELMGRYYGNARLVISASGATHPGEGCFLPGPSRDEVILPFYSHGAVTGSFKIVMSGPPFGQSGPAFSPLGNRGWATQEWWLSRRIVHFLEGYMVWSCACLDQFRLGILSNGHTQDLVMYSDWMSIASIHSRRALSRPTDRLAAIQGLANEFKKTRQDEYVMGFWTGELPTALLWKVGDDGRGNNRSEALSIFPSWAWASVACDFEEWYFATNFAEEESFEPMATVSTIMEGGMRLRVAGCMTTGMLAESCGGEVVLLLTTGNPPKTSE
ncbi:HET-domain-containing protein [Aspergillus costaricaensis CBS 115574]|uniref:HET-domain-containing protein n=1 Tax=Aspergillus costaricaensis CBS 115574 TaxID=1448317 RepID=A0ACD1IHW1_9EURO|nr:HET-domain-containing protein [Aspergillus costaricaensis CBS 115574]RAK90035.1 HET-domain-containing protein [Aspergillus costaricaensis CBS 115574]